MVTPTRVLVADDHVLFRRCIATLLMAHPQIELVGEAQDGLEAMSMACQLKPDLILMDIRMPMLDGLEATKMIKEKMPKVQVIVLTISDEEEDLFTALQSGADAYLQKHLSPEELFQMIEEVRHNGSSVSGDMAARILQEFGPSPVSSSVQERPFEELTPREREVLEQLVQGSTNREIGDALAIRENTVKIHLRRILQKLQVQNRIQAAVFAVRQGLLDET